MFSRGALLPTIVQTTGFKLSAPRQHNTYHQPMLTEEHVILPSSILTIEGQSVIFTILSSQHATPLHISRALDIQLDACTTSDRQGNRVPIVKSVTFIDNGEELRGGRRRRPRGEEFPPYGFCRCTIPFPYGITLHNFSFFEEDTTVQSPD